MPHLVLKTSQFDVLRTRSPLVYQSNERSDWDVGVPSTVIPHGYTYQEEITAPSNLSGPCFEELSLSHQPRTYQNDNRNQCDSVDFEQFSGQRLNLSLNTFSNFNSTVSQNGGHGSKDVIFGRGQGLARHVGNQAFRHFISFYKDSYRASKQSFRQSKKRENKWYNQQATKLILAEQIYRSWTGISGRFVKLSDTPHEVDGQECDVWVEVANKSEVLKKIKTSLREKYLPNPENISNIAKGIAREAKNLMPVDDEPFSKQRLELSFNTHGNSTTFQNGENGSIDVIFDRVNGPTRHIGYQENSSKDVIFGRGHGATRHVGNQAFRHFISLYKDSYRASKQSLRKSEKCKNTFDVNQQVTKLALAERIYYSWKGISGRFVKLSDSPHEIDGEENVWVEVAKNEVLKKIQADLREKYLLRLENISYEAKAISSDAQNLMSRMY